MYKRKQVTMMAPTREQRKSELLAKGLSDEFMNAVIEERLTHKKNSWLNLIKKLQVIFPDYAKYSPDDIKDLIDADPRNPFIHEEIESEIDIHCFEWNAPLNTYYERHKCPGQKIKYGAWDEVETEKFILLIESAISQGFLTQSGPWGLFSLQVPYRTGEQCRYKYFQLLKLDKVPTLRVNKIDEKSIHGLRINEEKYAFSREEEEILAASISKRITDGEVLLIPDVQALCLKAYYSPNTMAYRAATISCIKDNIDIFDYMKNPTEEFLKAYHECLELADSEPQKLFELYGLPTFTASISYIEGFFKRFGFALRKSRITRRGLLESKAVELYIRQVAEAIIKFGPDKVLNMDETNVRIAYFPDKVVGLRGSDSVPIYTTFNIKENFTAIGTISSERTYPLMILAKGSTIKCTEKFKSNDASDDYMVISTRTGWTDEYVMEIYFNFISDMVGSDFALILDSYRAHLTTSVREYAASKGITLIPVPSNGTGMYQPLDRVIFGIVKKMIGHDFRIKQYPNDSDRWRNAAHNLNNAWKRINKDQLQAAFDIPGLEQSIKERPIIENEDNTSLN